MRGKKQPRQRKPLGSLRAKSHCLEPVQLVPIQGDGGQVYFGLGKGGLGAQSQNHQGSFLFAWQNWGQCEPQDPKAQAGLCGVADQAANSRVFGTSQKPGEWTCFVGLPGGGWWTLWQALGLCGWWWLIARHFELCLEMWDLGRPCLLGRWESFEGCFGLPQTGLPFCVPGRFWKQPFCNCLRWLPLCPIVCDISLLPLLSHPFWEVVNLHLGSRAEESSKKINQKT